MRIPRFDGSGDIDIRRVRRLLGRYVLYWRRKGAEHGWPSTPINNAARNPAALIRKFRKDQRLTQRQNNWKHRVRR